MFSEPSAGYKEIMSSDRGQGTHKEQSTGASVKQAPVKWLLFTLYSAGECLGTIRIEKNGIYYKKHH